MVVKKDFGSFMCLMIPNCTYSAEGTPSLEFIRRQAENSQFWNVGKIMRSLIEHYVYLGEHVLASTIRQLKTVPLDS